MIELQNVNLTLGTYPVLEDISLSLGSNRFLAIMGPSGCGKTTLLRVAAGLLSATSGVVKIAGVPVDRYIEETNISIVFQKYSNISWLNALDNVASGLDKVQGRTERRRVALERLREVGLEKASKKYMRQLSGGMQQRVALARSLCQHSEVLLLDEPFAALDSFTRDEVNLVLKKLLRIHPRTVMLVSHSIDDVIALADEVVVLGGSPARVVGTLNLSSLRVGSDITLQQNLEIRKEIEALLSVSFRMMEA